MKDALLLFANQVAALIPGRAVVVRAFMITTHVGYVEIFKEGRILASWPTGTDPSTLGSPSAVAARVAR